MCKKAKDLETSGVKGGWSEQGFELKSEKSIASANPDECENACLTVLVLKTIGTCRSILITET